MRIPALSIKQPWAWLICEGIKPVENRSWSTAYRGPILIHAGKVFDGDFDFEWAARLAGCALNRNSSSYPRGGIVGEAVLGDCVVTHPSPWFFGPYGFVMVSAKHRIFSEARGALGIFFLDQVKTQKSAADSRITQPASGSGDPQGKLL